MFGRNKGRFAGIYVPFTTYVGTLEVEQWPNKMGRRNEVLLGTF
jgi:hypothetical protein